MHRVVGGLSTSATYFAEVVDATTIKLHDNLEQCNCWYQYSCFVVLWYWKTYFRVCKSKSLLLIQ